MDTLASQLIVLSPPLPPPPRGEEQVPKLAEALATAQTLYPTKASCQWPSFIAFQLISQRLLATKSPGVTSPRTIWNQSKTLPQ